MITETSTSFKNQILKRMYFIRDIFPDIFHLEVTSITAQQLRFIYVAA